jgi:magnesium chelatase family protein
MRERPFRAPHHTSSGAGLIGGGTVPHPGEASLAHLGVLVLFLDELPDFPSACSNPCANRSKTAAWSSHVPPPARPSPPASSSWAPPTRAGWVACRSRRASARPAKRQYLSRLSRSLLDRIDHHLEVPVVAHAELSEGGVESSMAVRARGRGHAPASGRRLAGPGAQRADERAPGAQLLPGATGGDATARTGGQPPGLSAHGHDRVLKVARTTADLAECERIAAEHVSEVVQYRGLWSSATLNATRILSPVRTTRRSCLCRRQRKD